MALVLLDRAKETTIVVGTTASAILLGAAPGYQSLAGVGNGNTTYYCIADQAGGLNWEVGLGTYTLVGTIITRAATPLSSSNAGASVSFPAGTKDVFIVYPSSKGVWLDASGNAIGLGTPAAFVATNVTGLPLTTGITGTLPVANGGTGVTTSTGSGNTVLSTSPTLVTPALGTPTSGVVTNLTGTASININGTVGATTATTGAFTTLAYTGTLTGSTGILNIGSGQIYKDASGNVGIGTSSPISSAGYGWLTVNGASAGGIVSLSNANTELFRVQAINSSTVLNTLTASPLVFKINNVEAMRIDSSGNLLITSPAGLGYGTGSGGTVTQATSKTTSVTLNKPTGQITTNNAALAGNASVTFVVSSSNVGANDTVMVNPSNNSNYDAVCINATAGAFRIRLSNITAGSLSEAVVLNFAIIQGATS